MLVEENDIAEAFALRRSHKLRKDEVPSIKPDGSRKQQSYLFREGH